MTGATAPLSENAGEILKFVQSNGPTTRQQLAERGYSESEVANAIAELFTKGAANPVDFTHPATAVVGGEG